jgi:hypothetical protein
MTAKEARTKTEAALYEQQATPEHVVFEQLLYYIDEAAQDGKFDARLQIVQAHKADHVIKMLHRNGFTVKYGFSPLSHVYQISW